MSPFTYVSRSQRVVFGAGLLQTAAAELDALGARRAVVLCTRQQRALAEQVVDLLGARAAGIFDGAVMHVPIETAQDARRFAAQQGADCAVAVGGGSTIGLGKAIAFDSGLPILAIPTTYAGSEMTPIYGLTEGGMKRTGRDPKVLPRTVLYDPQLTLGLPVRMSVVSGINAIAHAAEGLYAFDGNPVTSLLAEEGIAAIGRALPAIGRDAGDLQARTDALYGTWLCGTVLGSVAMGLHHKLCHTLGGSFDLPHAETHTIVLPHALAYNATAAVPAMRRVARALGERHGGVAHEPNGGATDATAAATAVYALARDNGAPLALKDIGLRAADLDRACEIALQNEYPNPRPLEARALRQLLQNAYDGAPPAA